MARKITGVVLFLPLLMCLLGANGISFDTGSPSSTVSSRLDGKGIYAVDPAADLDSVTFYAETGGESSQTTYKKANAASDKWDQYLSLTPGTYYSWGELVTINKVGGAVNKVYTYNVDPKNKVKVDVIK